MTPGERYQLLDRVAQALYEDDVQTSTEPWNLLSEMRKSRYRRRASAAAASLEPMLRACISDQIVDDAREFQCSINEIDSPGHPLGCLWDSAMNSAAVVYGTRGFFFVSADEGMAKMSTPNWTSR